MRAERDALCAILTSWELPEDVLTDSIRDSVEQFKRRGRHSKYLRLLREFAHGASLAALGKRLPFKWTIHWNNRGVGAGAIQCLCCRGPPVFGRGRSSHNQSGDPGSVLIAEAHYKSMLKIMKEESEPC